MPYSNGHSEGTTAKEYGQLLLCVMALIPVIGWDLFKHSRLLTKLLIGLVIIMLFHVLGLIRPVL